MEEKNRHARAGENDYLAAVNYSAPLSTWLASYPAGQVHVMQYEELLRSEFAREHALTRVKQFLGLRPDQPTERELPAKNMRKDRVGVEGWPMTRSEYQGLVNMIKSDCEM